MVFKLVLAVGLSLFLVSCEGINDADRTERFSDDLSPTPSNLTQNFTSTELDTLKSLCLSFQNMKTDIGSKHEFKYKNENKCLETNEFYDLTQMIELDGTFPNYAPIEETPFYFSEIRFDLEQNHPFSGYCSRLLSSDDTRRFYGPPSGFSSYTLEVIRGTIKNTSGCFDASMLAANSTNDLVCLRLWVDQKDAATGKLIQNLTYETATFVVSNALRAYSGFTVYREKHKYVKCSDDKKKSLVYKAIRLK